MEVGDLKLKTKINGKQSTVIGTPAEVAEFLDVARKKAIRRAVDALPRPVQHGKKPKAIILHNPGFGGNISTTKLTGQRLAEQIRMAAKTIQTPKSPFKPTFNAISQTREEIVKEAIADVAELLNKNHPHTNVFFRALGYQSKVVFVVDKNRRLVRAAVTVGGAGRTRLGIARCAPSDVFNEHVGKAIALRRALGLPVPTKYYEVGGIAPEGKQVGDVVYGDSAFEPICRLTAGGMEWVNGKPNHQTAAVYSSFAEYAKVIDDSARYVAPSTPAAKVVYVD